MLVEREYRTNEKQAMLRQELRAALATYWELGPAYEEQIVDSFVDRTAALLRRPAVRTVRRRRERVRGPAAPTPLLIALALIFGWLALAGPHFAWAHHGRVHHWPADVPVAYPAPGIVQMPSIRPSGPIDVQGSGGTLAPSSGDPQLAPPAQVAAPPAYPSLPASPR